MLGATIAVGADAWVVAGFLPQLADDMDVSVGAGGLAVTVFALTYALAAPALAAATSGQRPRTVISGALLVLAAANVLSAVSQDYTVFMAGRVLAALGACVVTPAAGVLAARVAGSEHRGRALALVISGLTIATAVGVPLGSLLAQVGSWRQTLLGVAGLGLLAALAIWVTAPNPEPAGHQSLAQRLSPLADRRVLAVLGLTVAGMTAAYIPYAYTAQLLPGDAGIWVVVTLACYGVGAVVGSLSSGHLTDRIGPDKTLQLAYLTMAVAFVVLAARPAASVIALAALIWGAASWMQTPAQQHRLLSIDTSSAPVTIGANASALYAGVALGNTVGAAVLGSGSRALCLCAGAVALVSLAWNRALANT